MRGVGRLRFHAPFNELCPAAIDPMIVDVARKRYAQAYDLMRSYGISVMVAHTGFVPMVYFEGWFIEKSAEFWVEFLADKPACFRLHLENMLEGAPDLLCRIAEAVSDDRFRICLDIGHAAIMSGGLPVIGWVERVLPLLGHVHLHNNHGHIDTHGAPSDGLIDVAAVIRAVERGAAGVTYTLESRDAGASVIWMRDNGFI